MLAGFGREFRIMHKLEWIIYLGMLIGTHLLLFNTQNVTQRVTRIDLKNVFEIIDLFLYIYYFNMRSIHTAKYHIGAFWIQILSENLDLSS